MNPWPVLWCSVKTPWENPLSTRKLSLHETRLREAFNWSRREVRILSECFLVFTDREDVMHALIHAASPALVGFCLLLERQNDSTFLDLPVKTPKTTTLGLHSSRPYSTHSCSTTVTTNQRWQWPLFFLPLPPRPFTRPTSLRVIKIDYLTQFKESLTVYRARGIMATVECRGPGAA